MVLGHAPSCPTPSCSAVSTYPQAQLGWRKRDGGRERRGGEKERTRGRMSQQKERKATQMLAIVLGESETDRE